MPGRWLGLFSHDALVLAAGSLYLRTVAPYYGCFGAGLMLYFASQGAGRVAGPFVAGSVRLSVAAGLGWLAVTYFHVDLRGLFALVALASMLFGLFTVLTTWLQAWTSSAGGR